VTPAAPGPGRHDRPTLVFGHANGFPAGTYRLLFEAWRAAGWRVLAPERLGHDPQRPPTPNWPHLRDELLDFVERHAGGQPVFLAGHSLGGFLSLLAASHRPARVAGVVLLDSPVLAGWRAQGLRVAQLSGLAARLSPGHVSRRRRQHWPDRAAALAHFAAKPVFARWDARVLADYVAAGTEPDLAGPPGPVRLAFRREVETRIYETLPHHLGPLLRRHPLRCPVAFIGGRDSVELRRVGLAATQALVGDRLQTLPGSHLFPMEHPEATAAAVLQALAPMAAAATAARAA
jgi:pimeloyl-ACP methyl ester carboxylesterase